MKLKTEIVRFLSDEAGQSTTEYILILSVVVMIAMKFKTVFQGSMQGLTQSLGNNLSTAEGQLDQSN